MNYDMDERFYYGDIGDGLGAFRAVGRFGWFWIAGINHPWRGKALLR